MSHIHNRGFRELPLSLSQSGVEHHASPGRQYSFKVSLTTLQACQPWGDGPFESIQALSYNTYMSSNSLITIYLPGRMRRCAHQLQHVKLGVVREFCVDLSTACGHIHETQCQPIRPPAWDVDNAGGISALWSQLHTDHTRLSTGMGR